MIQFAMSLGFVIFSILFLFLSAAVPFLNRKLSRHQSLHKLPRVGIDPGFMGLRVKAAQDEFFENGQKLLEQGYAQHKDTPYLIQTCDNERIVIPDKFIGELKNLPDTVISFKEELLDRFMGKWTRMDAVRGSNIHREIAQNHLTRNLPILVPRMKEEAEFALANVLVDVGKEDFTPVKASSLVFAAVGQITSRIIVNEPLSRDPKWLSTIIGYTASVAVFSMAMRRINPIFRPLAYYYLQSGRKLRQDVEEIKTQLVPVIKERQCRAESLKAETKEGPQDIIQWLLASTTENDSEPEAIVLKCLFLIVAAMHTSAVTLIHALYDLIAQPSCINRLEAEVNAETEQDGMTYATLQRLREMDAFLKESGRVNSAGVVSFQRLVLQPITLSNGFTIPPQTHICAASDARSRDQERYADPLSFKPLRFYTNNKCSKDAGIDAAGLFTSITAGDSWFGSGRQACPGRWYASAQIKIVLSLLIQQFDIKFPNGQVGRPQNWVKDEKTGPDMEQVILLRRKH